MFYQALTSGHEEERNQKFIYCYEGLGRVLYLSVSQRREGYLGVSNYLTT